MTNASKGFTLPKTCLIRKPWEYKHVYKRGRRLRGKEFTIIYVPNSGNENRLGISVHGFRKATQRNRIKRIIREFFRLNRTFIPPANDIVIAVRKGFEPDSLQEFAAAVSEVMQKKISPGGESRQTDP